VVDPPARFTSVIPRRARLGVGLALGGFGIVYRRCRHWSGSDSAGWCIASFLTPRCRDRWPRCPPRCWPATPRCSRYSSWHRGKGGPSIPANPDAPVRRWALGPGQAGQVVYLILEEQQEVHLLPVQWW